MSKRESSNVHLWGIHTGRNRDLVEALSQRTKAKFFLDVGHFFFDFFYCSLIFFAFAFAWCEWGTGNKLVVWNCDSFYITLEPIVPIVLTPVPVPLLVGVPLSVNWPLHFVKRSTKFTFPHVHNFSLGSLILLSPTKKAGWLWEKTTY